jgi:hypothetical protein
MTNGNQRFKTPNCTPGCLVAKVRQSDGLVPWRAFGVPAAILVSERAKVEC